MLKNLKKLIAGGLGALRNAVVRWHKEHFKGVCSCCHTPVLLKDLKEFKSSRGTFLICPGCSSDPAKLNKILYSCDMCENVFPDDSLTQFNHKFLCGKCLRERSFYCPECQRRLAWFKKFVTRSTVEICKTCAGKFKLDGNPLSEKANAILEKCHREKLKAPQVIGNDEEKECRSSQKTYFLVCARCSRSIAGGDEIFFEPTQRTFCKSCAEKMGLMNFYVRPDPSCSGCGKIFSANQLSEIGKSLLCRKCLDEYYPLCPICGRRIAADKCFHSTYLLEYCNACGRKLDLTRYVPPEDPEKTKQKSSGRRKWERKPRAYDGFQVELVSAPDEMSQRMADAEVLKKMLGGSRTSWRRVVSVLDPPPPPAPPKPSFSTNNYYHPDFDDNEDDDFVLDGIGGLDGKHDV